MKISGNSVDFLPPAINEGYNCVAFNNSKGIPMRCDDQAGIACQLTGYGEELASLYDQNQPCYMKPKQDTGNIMGF